MERRARQWSAMVLATLLASGCMSQAEAEPAVQRDTAPPWPAPRDGISYIRAAGLPEQPISETSDPWILTLRVSIDERAVSVAEHIGVDRPRAVQAPVHTHDESGQVWLEGPGNREVTLGQFFTVWGVRFTDRCLGDACGTMTLVVDGRTVPPPWGQVVLRGNREMRLHVSRHS